MPAFAGANAGLRLGAVLLHGLDGPAGIVLAGAGLAVWILGGVGVLVVASGLLAWSRG